MAENIYSMFRTSVEHHGNRPFIRTVNNESTYNDVHEKTKSFAARYQKAGLESGDTLGLILDNCPEFISAYLGAVRQGIEVACLNTSLQGDSLAHLLETANISVVLSTDELLESIESTCSEAGVHRMYSLTEDTKWESLQDGAIPAPACPDEESVATLLHTSGTTGYPKWCELSHKYFLRLGQFIADGFEISSTDTVFNPLPLYHINPLGYYLIGSITAGATVGLVERFSVSNFWKHVRSLEPTIVILHMAPKNMILNETSPGDATDHNIRVMFPADAEFGEKFGIPKMVTGYGSTEAGGLTHINKFNHVPELPAGEDLSQLAGYPRRDIEVRLVDKDGNPVSRGQHGEILIRPMETGVIFDGYRGAPESTIAAWEGLWFNTDDIGYIDSDGALHFVGRKGNSISHKGEFVNVDLVEALLESHSAVEQAVVVGEPDDVVGSRVKACVLTAGDVEPQTLVRHIESDIPSYMLPEYVDFIESIPRIEGTKKVDRKALQERTHDAVWRRSE